jgi:hypothetical protein
MAFIPKLVLDLTRGVLQAQGSKLAIFKPLKPLNGR